MPLTKQIPIKTYPIQTFAELPINQTWSFSDQTLKQTAYITHGIYTYPAKFIPQLAAKLILEHSQENDRVIDPFMGSGTTIVEAILNHRRAIGTDINEMAVLLTRVKSTPIDEDQLLEAYANLISCLQYQLNTNFPEALKQAQTQFKLPERIDYWFRPQIKNQLMIILSQILSLKPTPIKELFLVIFAQILKSCSIWLQKSVKPTRDLKKKEMDPLIQFERQAQKTLKRYHEFHLQLPSTVKAQIETYRQVKHHDARNLPCEPEQATLIVTSPPYVTSYEYADLHQLPLLWFGFLKELSSFRPKFIGSASRQRSQIELRSPIAQQIVTQLGNNKTGREVEHYFADMLESFVEMKRVLKRGGKAAIVIGNTQLKGVNILNAEVFQEQLESLGFQTHQIIHREIPSKMLPSTRNPKNGRFTKANHDQKSLVYPTEYILIMEKISH